jgi:hypothetical protein
VTIKPEIRIALVQEAEKARHVLSSEYQGKWVRLWYVGAVLLTLTGVGSFTSAIGFIASHHVAVRDHIIGSVLILVAMIFMLMPWYFLVRYFINRKMQLLSEAILSVSQFDGYIVG